MKKEFIISVLCFGILLLGGFFGREVKAADFVVTKTADTNAACNSNVNCSLREAVAAANGSPSNDRIFFNSSLSGQIIQLTLGELYIGNQGTLSIEGLGEYGVVTNGMAITSSNSRMFYIDHATVIISNVTIAGGKGTGAGGGSLSNSGGAIFNAQGDLTLDTTYVAGNGAWYGGGIYNFVGTLRLNRSLVGNNSAALPSNSCCGLGGGIFNAQGTLIIDNSTVFSNSAQIGGGIYSTGKIVVTNTTINDNQAYSEDVSTSPPQSGFGGGIYLNQNASVSGASFLKNVTVSGNLSSRYGAGVDSTTPLRLHNTIIGGNYVDRFYPQDPYAFNPDINGNFISDGYNIIGVKGNVASSIFKPSDKINVDPKLSPGAALNGALTLSFSLQLDSPAIDASDPADSPSTDQRGYGRPTDGNADGTAQADIGAFELGTLVSNTSDAGNGSLRNAIATIPANGEIIFSPSFSNQSQIISLTASQQFVINKNITITGPGANLLTIDGGNASRIFKIASGATLNLSGITLKNGNANGTPEGKGGAIYSDGTINASNIAVRNSQAPEGGGIYNNGTLNLTTSIVADCSSSFGGGIYNASGKFAAIDNSTVSGNNNIGLYNGGTMNVINSTVSGNNGGGILNSATLSLLNSTVSGNQANGKGAGIYNNGGGISATVVNSTITDNRGFGYAGAGAWNESGSTFRVRNTIIDNNFSDSGSPDYVGGRTDLGNNIIGTRNPGLAPLGNYGGATQTHALLQTSPALNAGNNCVLTANGCGDNNAALTTDQRGAGVLRKIGTQVDIGAFERNIAFDQSTLPKGNIYLSYNQQLSATRQTSFAEFGDDQLLPESPAAPFTFSIVPIAGQQLPPGLSLSSDGTISGTPSQGGTFTFTVKATDTDGTASAQQYTIQVLAPTAASVSVSGRVLTPQGGGLTNATVVLTDASGNTRSARTSAFGYYRFDEIAAGQTCIVTVVSKRYQFTPQVITVTEDLSELNFTAQQ